MERYDRVSSVQGDNHPGFYFSFTFKRKQQYYYVTIFLTIELLIALQLSGIILHPSDSNRAAYSITVILGFSISQQIFTENIPKTSQTVYLFIYIGSYMVIGSLVTFYSVFMCLISDSARVKNRPNVCGLPFVRFIDLVVFSMFLCLIILINCYYFIMTSF